MMCFSLVFFLVSSACFAAEGTPLEEKAREAEKIKQIRQETAKVKREVAEKAGREALEKTRAKLQEHIAEIDLPEDTSPHLTVRQLHISGNSLISTAELLKNMPLIYNASDKPLRQADSNDLYDFRLLHDIILEPGQPRQLSTRTIQGFTMYIPLGLPEPGLCGHICICACTGN